MENRNTEQALHFLISNIKSLRNTYNYTAIIEEDIVSAFDSINFKDNEYALKSRCLPSSFIYLIMIFILECYLLFYHLSTIAYLGITKDVY